MKPSIQQQLPRRRRTANAVFAGACLAATLLCLLILVLLLAGVFQQGIHSVDWHFVTSLPSRSPANAGIKSAIVGSLWLVGLATLFSAPLGVGAAIYLEEYAADSRTRRFIQLNIANLAGVPSIVFGILGLALFVRRIPLGGGIEIGLGLGPTILAGALTLSMVVLPIIILSSQEALRAVPPSLRHGSFALGATRWQTVWHQVLPASIPGILTGAILAISRALGEAAPLLLVGAAVYLSFVPSSPTDEFSALPIQIFNWAERPQRAFHDLAAGGIIVLIAVLLVVNGLAIFLRYRYGKRISW
jgi:phosphate transport system permease protein